MFNGVDKTDGTNFVTWFQILARTGTTGGPTGPPFIWR